MSEPKPLADIRKFVSDGLLEEYNHGVDDGLNIALSGLKKVFEHEKLPDDMRSGLDMAIDSIKALQEELANTRNKSNTVTETNGEKSDG